MRITAIALKRYTVAQSSLYLKHYMVTSYYEEHSSDAETKSKTPLKLNVTDAKTKHDKNSETVLKTHEMTSLGKIERYALLPAYLYCHPVTKNL